MRLGRLDRDPPVAEADADPLDHLVPGRRLGFTRLSLQAEVAEQAAEGVEGGVGQVAEVHGVEVVDIVAAEQEDEGPLDELHRRLC